MNKEYFTFPSAFEKKPIHAVMYQPEGEAKGLLQVIHGFAEHIERYDDFMQFFANQGFVVFGDDHLGHGKTAVNAEDRTDVGTYNALEYMLQDELTLSQKFKSEYPNLPFYMLGHSMGSLMLRGLLGKYPDICDKAIIMGTGDMSPALLSAFGVVLNVTKLFHKGTFKSPLINNLALGKNDKLFKNENEKNTWLSTNRENIAVYNADSLAGNPGSIYTFKFLHSLMKLIRQKDHLSKMKKDLPVLFVSGQDDAFGDFGKGVKKVIDLFHQAGMQNVQQIFYPHMRHEILKEDASDKVIADILQFITVEK